MKTLLLVVCLPLALLGCKKPGESIGKNQPPPFMKKSVDPLVRSSMKSLAYQIDALALALESKPGEKSQKQNEVVSHLRDIDATAKALVEGGEVTHPMFKENAKALLQDVDRAIFSAALDTPNYYYAGKITGSCQYCHQPKPYSPPMEMWRRSEGRNK